MAESKDDLPRRQRGGRLVVSSPLRGGGDEKSEPTSAAAPLPARTTLLLLVLNLIPWLLFLGWSWYAGTIVAVSAVHPAQDALAHDVQQAFAAKGSHSDAWVSLPGAWGDLEYRWIHLETPPEYLAVDEIEPLPVRWYFDTATMIEARRQLIEWGLPDAQLKQLDQVEEIWEPAAEGGGFLLPPLELVESLPAGDRERIYQKLILHPRNPCSLFIGKDVESWFAGSTVSASVIDLVKKMSFRRGSVHVFCDKTLALRKCATEAERRELVRCLNRRATVVARLRLESTTDYNSLLQYWFPDRRPRAVEPFLRELSAGSGDSTVDLIHLLSPFARERLYTFPLLDEPFSQELNCAWSAIRYLNPQASNSSLSQAEAAQLIQQDFYPVNATPGYGDLALFLSPKSREQLVHVAVYLAGDLLFAKNGNNARNPWVLMPRQEMQDLYSLVDPEIVVRYYRRKPFVSGDD